ncbi:MAG: acylneuraminate cytidylyltransferase family protein, partial [Candidatus Zambryskibacteria bacterium CG_4_9_14_3_um_filter_40_16]
MKIIGIIPARKGSKSIPLKNLKDFCGNPLIAWSIISAKKSKLDRVIVSTDSTEIAKIAKSFGAETPYLQPANISGDAVGMETILKYAYEWLINKEDYKPDALMLLQSTSPLRQTFQIDEMIKIFKETNADSVVAVNETPANHTPY